MITNHTQILNWLIEKYKYRTYLEIGVQSTKQNFDKIKAGYKVGVDPDVKGHKRIYTGTSDEFFNNNHLIIGGVDLIFIDGLHHADQVQRDFENSLKCLNEGGRIVIHDTLPENEKGTLVPRETKQWWGDVYKFAMRLDQMRDIKHYTVNMDNGCTVVWQEGRTAIKGNIDSHTWDQYMQFRDIAMNIIQPSEIETYL